jgi:hypothetical protein
MMASSVKANPVMDTFYNILTMQGKSNSLRCSINLDEMSAGSLVGTPTGMFKGLDNSTKAVFSNQQSNEHVLFRPFVIQK